MIDQAKEIIKKIGESQEAETKANAEIIKN
jgi:hypothetical protein